MVETADLGSFPKLLTFNNLKIVNINQRTMHFRKKGPITNLHRTSSESYSETIFVYKTKVYY